VGAGPPNSNLDDPGVPQSERLISPPLFALFLAAFAVGTTEFVITGILPQVAADLAVSIPTAGYLISGYALGVAVGGPIIAVVTSRFERKAALLGLMTIFILGNALCALAPSYAWLMAARIVISFSHGAFFGIAGIAATSLVPENRRAAAISLILAGITVANIVGVPAGVAIGNAFGWRSTFAAIAGLGIVSAIGTALWLPRGQPGGDSRAGLAKEFTVLGRQEVYLSLIMIVSAAAGFFAIFAYIAPLLIDVSGVPPLALPWLLSAFGVGALIGNLAGGRLADRNLMPSVIGSFVIIAVVNVMLLFAVHNLVSATVVLFIWSLANFAFGAPLQSRILKGASDAPTLASTLVSTAFNVGISAGAAIGAQALIHGAGYAQLPWLGLAGALPALGLALLAHSLDRREGIAAVRPPA
jgi:DHA1 family inner membrane transport protein